MIRLSPFDNALFLFNGTRLPPSLTLASKTPPTNFAAVANGTVSVTLTWASTPIPGATQYAIWRDGIIIAYSTTSPFVDTTVTAGRRYRYAVSAADSYGTWGDQSISLWVDVLQGNSLDFQVTFQEQPGEGGLPDTQWSWK